MTTDEYFFKCLLTIENDVPVLFPQVFVALPPKHSLSEVTTDVILQVYPGVCIRYNCEIISYKKPTPSVP